MAQPILTTPADVDVSIASLLKKGRQREKGIRVYIESSNVVNGIVYEVYTVHLPKRFINNHVISTMLDHGTVPIGFCDLRVSSAGQVFSTGCFGSRNESLQGLVSDEMRLIRGIPHRDIRFSKHNPSGDKAFLIHNEYSKEKDVIEEFYGLAIKAALELGAKPSLI